MKKRKQRYGMATGKERNQETERQKKQNLKGQQEQVQLVLVLVVKGILAQVMMERKKVKMTFMNIILLQINGQEWQISAVVSVWELLVLA